jgi:SSS family solute:Na+ symporter
MTFWDWLLVWVPLVFVAALAAYTQRFNKSVADFIAAGRCAGRYLLTTARGTAGSAVYTIGLFQITGKAGFTFAWWSLIPAPILLLVASTGFVFYRYRETRALTVAQFFEMRYSRAFRLFMGGLAFLAGILNYGIFPAVSARFFVYFLGLPTVVPLLGFHPPTWTLIALAYLSCTLFFVLTGGQISLLITDCVEGIFSQVGYLIIATVLVFIFSWHQVIAVLSAAPPGASMLNPFDTQKAKDYNVWFVLIGIFTTIYGTMAWQNSHGFNSAALTPHESRMSNVLATWRGFAGVLMRCVLVMSAITFVAHPAFAAASAPVHGALQAIPNDQIRDQMRVPVALSFLLPAGLKGLFCSLMLLGVISGDAIAMHSWGSIFIQDVVLPARKEPVSQKTHMRLLRLSITGVAAFAFCFSLLFSQTQDIFLWWTITGAVFVGGAGSVIIGGLYWKKGTTAAAWSSMLTGSILSLGAIALQQMDPGFPIHSQYLGLIVTLIAITVYIAVSLLTHREDFNMDRLLHRGKYSIQGEHLSPPEPYWKRFHPAKMLGLDAEYSFWDRVITVGLFGWTMFWFLFFIAGCVWNYIRPWPLAWWENYWLITGILLPFVIAFLTTVWFTWGGIHDIRLFFRKLRVEKRDVRDDGTVAH